MLRNVAALYGIHLVNLALPLVAVPYLARTLGPAGWGPVLAAQALALWTALLVDYGFNLSATREVARRPRGSVMSRIVAGVLGAKVLLAGMSLVLWAAATLLVPAFRERPELSLLGSLAGLAQSFNPLWFFQGVQQLRLPAAAYVAARIGATAAIFVFVTSPNDGWVVLALQLGAGVASTAFSLALLYRRVRWEWPNFERTREALRLGTTMFVYRASVSLYTVANPLIVGVFLPASQIAVFAGAERLSRAALSGFTPISQAVFPHLSHLVTNDESSAARLAVRSLTVLTLIAGTGAFLGWVVAPSIVRLLLGPEFDASIDVLRTLVLAWPPIAISTVLGVQWMLPLRLDGAFNAIVISAGATNLILAVLLVPRLGPAAMAWAVVCAEWLVAAAMVVTLRRRRLDPFSVSRRAGDPAAPATTP